MFGVTNIVKNSHESKYVYSGYGIVFGGEGLWGIGNSFARNVAFFSVDNSSSSPADNRKTNFLVLGGRPTDIQLCF